MLYILLKYNCDNQFIGTIIFRIIIVLRKFRKNCNLPSTMCGSWTTVTEGTGPISNLTTVGKLTKYMGSWTTVGEFTSHIGSWTTVGKRSSHISSWTTVGELTSPIGS